MENEVGTILPQRTEAATPEKPTDVKQKCTTWPDWAASPSSKFHSSDDDSKDEDYVSCIGAWLGFNLDCKTMLEDETMMLAHHQRNTGSEPALISQPAANCNPEWLIEPRAQMTACMYVMGDKIVRFDTRLGKSHT